ncbi:nitrate reductase molybdenum cofactor assembly chaperone [Marinimicrococcus flavescens]|uniref:Nitrate reductase molybdenum cofactor assembly chaperone n=1 Tax=Marinimicrococcus flavescens TaxID=3031815 RepID=A0AAP3XSR3_9PROT|nr:nitrate reductase molybdenum cofactor assembly chaperone [Marinimicrococcus flavescens]
MARTFKALSALLSYPTAELCGAAGELRTALRGEALVPSRRLALLDRLLDELAARDLYDLQERYTLLFDRSRSLSLHLFEHIHGESRDRGQAMVDLARHYESRGFVIAASELPDFLPLFLEFLSLLPEGEARALLAEPAEVLRTLEERLRRRRSIYAGVFLALLDLAGEVPAAGARMAPADEVDPEDLAALDAEWEETAVTFGPGDPMADSCGRTRLATRLRAAVRSVADRAGH